MSTPSSASRDVTSRTPPRLGTAPLVSTLSATTAARELAQRLVSGAITPAQYLGISPEWLYKVARLGHDMLERGYRQQAIDLFKGLVAASPHDSVFHCHLAAAYVQAERFQDAMDAFTSALRFNRANVDALSGRGELFLREGRVAEALQDLQAALQNDPSGQRESTQRARSLLRTLQKMADAAESTPTP